MGVDEGVLSPPQSDRSRTPGKGTLPFEPGQTYKNWVAAIDNEVEDRNKRHGIPKSALPLSTPFVGSTKIMSPRTKKSAGKMKWTGAVASTPCWLLKTPTPPSSARKRGNQSESPSSGLVLQSRPVSKSTIRSKSRPVSKETLHSRPASKETLLSALSSTWDPALMGMKTYAMSQSGRRRQSFFSLQIESPLEEERRLKLQDDLHQSTMFSARNTEFSETILPNITQKPIYGNDVTLYSTKPYQTKMTRSQKILLHPQPVRPGRGLKKATFNPSGSFQASRNSILLRKKNQRGLIKKLQHVESGRPLPWNQNYEGLMKKTISEGHYSPEYKDRRAANVVPPSYPRIGKMHSPIKMCKERPNKPSSPGYYTQDDEISAVTDGFSYIPSPPITENPDQSQPFSRKNYFQDTRFKGGVRSKEMARNLESMENTSKSLGAKVRQAYYLRKRHVELGLLDPTSANITPSLKQVNSSASVTPKSSIPPAPPSDNNQANTPQLMSTVQRSKFMEGFIKPAIDIDWKRHKLHDMSHVVESRDQFLYPAAVDTDFQGLENGHRRVVLLLKTVGDDLGWPESEREAFIDSKSNISIVDFAELVSKLNHLLSLHNKLHEVLMAIEKREKLLEALETGTNSSELDSELESLTLSLQTSLPLLNTSLDWLNGIVYNGVDYLKTINSFFGPEVI